MTEKTSNVVWTLATYEFFLVNYVEEGPWWPTKSPEKGRKKKVKG